MRKIVNRSEVKNEDQQMGNVELPDPAQHPRSTDEEAPFHHHLAENKRRRVAGNQHEEIGSIAKAVVPHCEPCEYAVRNVP